MRGRRTEKTASVSQPKLWARRTWWSSIDATLEQVEAERHLHAEYAASRTAVINLSFDEEGDGTRGSEGDKAENVGSQGRTRIFSGGSIFDAPDDVIGPDPMLGGMSRAEWKEVTEESDSD